MYRRTYLLSAVGVRPFDASKRLTCTTCNNERPAIGTNGCMKVDALSVKMYTPLKTFVFFIFFGRFSHFYNCRLLRLSVSIFLLLFVFNDGRGGGGVSQNIWTGSCYLPFNAYIFPYLCSHIIGRSTEDVDGRMGINEPPPPPPPLL